MRPYFRGGGALAGVGWLAMMILVIIRCYFGPISILAGIQLITMKCPEAKRVANLAQWWLDDVVVQQSEENFNFF